MNGRERSMIPIVSVDTDGSPDLIAPSMIKSGVNLLFPMEVAAGCDTSARQVEYSTLCMLGGIDNHALAQGPEAIDRERNVAVRRWKRGTLSRLWTT